MLSLKVLEDAAVAEVIDVPAQIHQLRVDAVGHMMLGGASAVGGAGHQPVGGASTVRGVGHQWGVVGHALRAALHQGTKSTVLC